MKKLSFAYTILAILLLSGCRKEDNPKIPELTRVPLPLITIDNASDQLINPAAPASFKGKVNVDLYFKNDIPPQKMDIVVMKNEEAASTKTLKADVTSFPTVIDITGQQLIDLFGPIADGDRFDIGADITTRSGQLFQAFPALGEGYGAGVNTQGGASTSIFFTKPCGYDPDLYQGEFVVVKDDWHDTDPGDIIVLTKIDATHFSFKYPTAVDAEPIIVTVDPATNTPSIALQTIGTAWVYDADPPPPTAKTTPAATNLIDPCNATVSLNMTWTEATGSYPNLVLSLKKK